MPGNANPIRIGADMDLELNHITNFIPHPITTAQRITLGLILGVAQEGLMCYDLDDGAPYFWNGTAWGVPSASITIASNAETLAGLTAVKAVSPAGLKYYNDTKQYAKSYSDSNISMVANIATTITHNLGLQTPEAFNITLRDQFGAGLYLDVEAVDNNTVRLMGNITENGICATITGF